MAKAADRRQKILDKIKAEQAKLDEFDRRQAKIEKLTGVIEKSNLIHTDIKESDFLEELNKIAARFQNSQPISETAE